MTNRYLIFFVTSSSLLVFSMQFSMVSVALPELIEDLDAPLRWSSWVLIIFMVGQIVSLPVAGRLAERFGPRHVFVTGFACFAASSLVAALAPHIAVLILARAAQGMAGGALMPSAMGIVGSAFAEARARPIGLLGSVMPIGGIIGPSLGGLIVDLAGWRWTFALNVPFGILVVVAALLITPAPTPTRAIRIDFSGIGALGVGVLGFVLAITELGRDEGEPSIPLILGSALLCVIGIAVMVRRQLSVPDPIIDLDLLRRREFVAANLLGFCFGVGLFAVFSLLPYYLSVVYDMSASEAGALLSPRAMAMVASSATFAMLLPLTGYRKPIIAGLFGLAFVLVVLSFDLHEPTILGVGLSNTVWIAAVLIAMGAAFGAVNPSLNNASLDLAPDRIPAIIGLRGMFMNIGGVTGITLMALAAERAPTPGDGLSLSFRVIAVALVFAIVLVLQLPEMQGHRHVASATADGSSPARDAAPATPRTAVER